MVDWKPPLLFKTLFGKYYKMYNNNTREDKDGGCAFVGEGETFMEKALSNSIVSIIKFISIKTQFVLYDSSSI